VGSDDWNVRIRDLAAAVQKELAGARVTFGAAPVTDARSYRVDFSLFGRLAPAELQPHAGLTAVVHELRDGLTGMGFADADFRRGPLMRLNALRRLRDLGLVDDQLRWTRSAEPGPA
jgi:UDP-glucose 4-epimerase